MTETKTLTDAQHVEIRLADRVRVTSWGYGARLADCGTVSAVHRINRTRVEITDSDGQRRTVGAKCLMVLRRDGGHGYEASNLEAVACRYDQHAENGLTWIWPGIEGAVLLCLTHGYPAASEAYEDESTSARCHWWEGTGIR